jgi:V/A-type H+-transporting ATPase subunit I
LFEKKNCLSREIDELGRYRPFLDSLALLLKGMRESPNLEFIGLTIKYPEALEELRELVSRITGGRSEMLTSTAADGTLVGLIITEKALSQELKKSLTEENMPELSFPSQLKELPFPRKVAFLKERLARVFVELERVDAELRRFSLRWKPIYRNVRDWLEERLSVLVTVACAFQTEMCFFLYGWIPAAEVRPLRKRLDWMFSGRVLMEEKEIFEKDIEKVPIALWNPGYFKPFEILTKMLPLPRYSSYDPTPFLSIFFPLFFGMILGDVGYGTVLLAVSAYFAKKRHVNKTVQDAAKILFVCALYSVFFGLLFGELFGYLGQRLFGLHAILIERQKAVMPMLIFAVTVGVFHVTLGLVLGLLSALRKKQKKESLFKLLNILFILSITVIAASQFGAFPALLEMPLVIAILVMTPLLLYSGGLLAPLEILKSIGNIISYARIMAIGLTSVLLAFVANRLGGLSGDIAIGLVVGGLLHAINLVLGVFSPAIHSIRLHYVEFFGKFLEPGGRKFEPLRKKI